MATQTTLTSQGLKDLEERLEHLKSVTRKEIAEKIKVALSFGDLSENSEYVNIGNTVVIEDESGKKIKFFLVGSKEVDMKAMKISDESPIGKACIGRKLGEEVSVEAPAGVKKYKIVEIDK